MARGKAPVKACFLDRAAESGVAKMSHPASTGSRKFWKSNTKEKSLDLGKF